MPNPIRSAYEVALSRDRMVSQDEDHSKDGFFVDDRPSKILGSRAKHPSLKEKNNSPTSQPAKDIPLPSSEKRKGLDMNAYISCNVTLSNKLRKAIKNGSTASLFMGPFDGNKANGFLRFETSDSEFENLKSLANTSIMLEVVDCGEDIPEIGNENPVVSFGTSPLKLVEKVAITNPRTHPANAHQTKVNQKKISEEEKKLAIKAALKRRETFVNSYEDLIDECNKIPGIDTSVPVSKKPKNGTRFTRAEAMEYEKELMSLPKLKRSVFIKNNHASRIEIGDLSIGENNLILAPFEVFDLSRLPARMVRDSSNLRSLVMSKSKFISFVGMEDYEQWVDSLSEVEIERNTGYKAFSGERASELAAETMFGSDSGSDEPSPIRGKTVELDEKSAMEITEEDLQEPVQFDSEETTNLLRTMPKERASGFVHVPAPPKPSDGSKSIRRV